MESPPAAVALSGAPCPSGDGLCAWLPDGALLPDDGLLREALDEALLDDGLLDEELEDELLREALEDELLWDALDDELLWEELEELLWDELDELELGDDGVGMLGGCGVVGVLALGQPLRRAAQHSAAAALRSGRMRSSPKHGAMAASQSRHMRLTVRRKKSPVRNVISPAKALRIHRQPVAEARPEKGGAHATDDLVSPGVVSRVVVESLDVHDAATIRHREF